MSGRFWTDEERALLRSAYSERGYSLQQCVELFPGRSFASVKGQIQSLGMTGGSKDTPRRDGGPLLTTATLPDKPHAVAAPLPEPVDPVEAERERAERRRALQEEREALRAIAGERSMRHMLETLFRQVTPSFGPAPRYTPPKPRRKHASRESLLLHLSDWHYGERVESEATRGFNAYSVDIAEQRVRSVVANAVQVAGMLRDGGGWEFPRLVVALNGDLVTGTIHELERHSDPENIVWAVYGCGLLLAESIRTLAGQFDQVDVFCTSGNHGRLPDARRMQSKDPTRNWDTLVALIAKTALAEQANVSVTIPQSYAVSYEVEGVNVLQSHGHDIKSWSGIPWYGIGRFLGNYNGLEASRGGRIGAYLFGHFHSQTNITYPGGEAFVNGSLIGGTEWTIGTLGRADRPCQMMLGFHADHGVTHRWPIYPEG
jgi:hypothetical protein